MNCEVRMKKLYGLIVAGTLALAQDKGPDRAPKVGDDAPGVKLKVLGEPSKQVELSSFKGKKDVMLIFGSYT